MSGPAPGPLRRVLAVRGERHRGRPALERPAHGAARVRRGGAGPAGQRAGVGRPARPSWCSSTAGARTPTPGTRWPWPSTGRWWPSTCPGTGTPTGPGDDRALDPAGHGRRRGRGHRAVWPPTPGWWWACPSGASPPSPWPPPTRTWCARLVLVDITPGVNHEKSSDIAAFLAGPETFASFDEILERTIQFNPTRSESSLRRGVLHNAVQREDGTWTWRHQLGRPSGATGIHVDSVDSATCGTTSRPSPRPVLLVRGALSPVVDDADEAEFRRRRPADRVVTVEDAGHSIQGDQPLELARPSSSRAVCAGRPDPPAAPGRSGGGAGPPRRRHARSVLRRRRPVDQRGGEHLADVRRPGGRSSPPGPPRARPRGRGRCGPAAPPWSARPGGRPAPSGAPRRWAAPDPAG